VRVWGDGLYLRLRCTVCNRVREHFVQHVLLDLRTLEQQEQGRPVAHAPYIRKVRSFAMTSLVRRLTCGV